ncbi:hypothetical protein HID58_021428 [Brassica napus]|uniref:Uncharacterized protein n=1 Tax=Brassica napus TaxID=3708 RepID=A0ABQ8CWD4_BRANA|nr:hypothetical protein HID58_021428 [Brassica napus]
MLKTQANGMVDTVENGSHVLEKEHGSDVAANAKSQLVRYQVLELGIVVHSVVCQSSIDCAIWRKNEMGNGVFLLGHHTVSGGKDYYRMGHAYVAKGYSPASPRALIVVGVRILLVSVPGVEAQLIIPCKTAADCKSKLFCSNGSPQCVVRQCQCASVKPVKLMRTNTHVHQDNL